MVNAFGGVLPSVPATTPPAEAWHDTVHELDKDGTALLPPPPNGGTAVPVEGAGAVAGGAALSFAAQDISPGRRLVSVDSRLSFGSSLDPELVKAKPTEGSHAYYGNTQRLFVDAEEMKEQVRRALVKKKYDVFDYYKTDGVIPRIAKSQVFENITLLVIIVNSVWMWIDTDFNKADNLVEADAEFQVMEHFFCLFFSFEWFIRFSSFQRKRDGLRDNWFVFDSCLVSLMVMETWVMTLIVVLSGGSPDLFDASILRLFRLLRLSRLARMLRSMPELMILIKGIMAATRSVVFTLLLLVMLLYMFAIAMTQLTAANPVVSSQSGLNYFGNIPRSMYHLLMTGVFLDNLGPVMEDIGNTHPIFAVIFMLFIALAALMVMNMLIGVLCEVVSAVAAAEREDMLVTFVREKMCEVLKEVDNNSNGMISREEFKRIVVNENAVRALNEVGVDAESLCDFADYIFDSDDDTSGVSIIDGEVQINFERFMNIILDFRGSNVATVKHIMSTMKMMKSEFRYLLQRLHIPSKSAHATGALSVASCKSRQNHSEALGHAALPNSISSDSMTSAEALDALACGAGRPPSPRASPSAPRGGQPAPALTGHAPTAGAASVDIIVRTARAEALLAAARAELAALAASPSPPSGAGARGLPRHPDHAGFLVVDSEERAAGTVEGGAGLELPERRLRDWAASLSSTLVRELQDLQRIQRVSS